MPKFLNVKNGIVEVPKEEFEHILAKQEMYFDHARYWQYNSYLLSLLISRIPIDHQLLIGMLQDENNHLIERLRELSGDCKFYERLLSDISKSNCLDEIKFLAQKGLE